MSAQSDKPFISLLPSSIQETVLLKEAIFEKKKAFCIELKLNFSLSLKVQLINLLNPDFVAVKVFINTQMDLIDALKNLKKIKNLKAIWIEETDQIYLTQEWAILNNLEVVSLRSSDLKFIPPFLLGLPNLKHLDLGYDSYKQLPVHLKRLESLTILDKLYDQLVTKTFPLFLEKEGIYADKKASVPSNKDFENFDILKTNLIRLKTIIVSPERYLGFPPFDNCIPKEKALWHLVRILISPLNQLLNQSWNKRFKTAAIEVHSELFYPIDVDAKWDENKLLRWAAIILNFDLNTVDTNEYDVGMIEDLLLTQDATNLQLAIQLLKGLETIPKEIANAALGLVFSPQLPQDLKVEIQDILEKVLPPPVWVFFNQYFAQHRYSIEDGRDVSLQYLVQYFVPFDINESIVLENLILNTGYQLFRFHIDLEKEEKLPERLQKIEVKKMKNIKLHFYGNGNITPILNQLAHFESIDALYLYSMDGKTKFPTSGVVDERIKRVDFKDFDGRLEAGEGAVFKGLEKLSWWKGNGFAIDFTCFPKLTKISIQECSIFHLDLSPVATSLKTLGFYTVNWIEAFNAEFPQLENLQDFTISKCGLIKIPQEISGLIRIQKLNFGDNLLQEIPDFISLFPMLRELHLRQNQIFVFPKFSHRIEYLMTINIENNSLRSFESDLSEFPNLRQLHMANNLLKTLPNFSQKTGLQSINLQANRIQKFPTNLLTIPSLNSIATYGNNIYQLTALDLKLALKKQNLSLSLRNNHIQILPSVEEIAVEISEIKGSIELKDNPIPIDIKEQYSLAFGDAFKF